MKQYTISVSEIDADGTTLCKTWLAESEIARALRTSLLGRYGQPNTSQMFSADAVHEAVANLPIVEL